MLSQGYYNGLTNYKGISGANWPVNGSGFTKYRKSDVGLGGRNANAYNGLDFGDGWCCRGASGTNATPPGRPITTSIAQVADGTSSTLAIGEAVPEYCNWSTWYNFEGSTATCAIPMNLEIAGVTPAAIASNWQQSMGLRSQHAGGMNLCFLDGHVRWVTKDIALVVYKQLATIDGGEVIPQGSKY